MPAHRGYPRSADFRASLPIRAPSRTLPREAVRRGRPVTDVFVSYKAEDRRRVAPLVDALEAGGLSVWWDARIGAGTGWRKEISDALDAARCVIVVWSKRSIGEKGGF